MTTEDLMKLQARAAADHAGTVDDPIPQQLLYTKTAEDGTKKVYTVAAGIAIGDGGTANVKDATDTVKGIAMLSDAVDSDKNAASGVTAATPLAVKNALAEAKAYTDTHAGTGADATDVVKGINKLSDAIDSDLDAATGVTAATPKAVKLALAEAKRYTDENSGADVSDATDTVKGINMLSDAIDSDLNAATGKTAATPLAVKQSIAAAKEYTDTKADETLQAAKEYTDQNAGGGTMAYVLTPTITTPAHDATDVSTLPTIAASAYRNVFETDARQHRVFQVASDSGFGTLLVNQNVNADSYAVTSQLTPSTKLYCRVRDVAVSGLQSEWSNTVAFTTAAGVVANTPVVTLHGYADSPTDILSGLTITTNEYSVSGGALDAHRATSWSIATKDGTRANVWQSLEDTTNKTSITVPDGTLQKGTAYTLSVTFHGTTAFDSSPAVVEFTTSADFGTVNAPTLTVEGGPNTVYETPTLTGGAFSNTRDTDTHDMTDWEVLDATGATPIWQSLNDTSNKTTIKVQAGKLLNSTAYKARVRYHGAKYGWSAYTTVDFTTVAHYNVVNKPTITVQGAPDNIKETPTLTGSPFAGINVTHKSTDWIITDTGGTEIWSSKGDTSNLTSIKVPKGHLQVSTSYIFKVRYNANESVSSEYAEATYTTAAEFIRYNYIGVPGTSTFGVGLAEEKSYTAVQLSPADNCLVETDFQYGLYVRGEVTAGKDAVAMKWIPKFYVAMLQKNQGTENLSDGELDALLPYVEVTKEQMKEAQRRSPHNAMVVAPSDMFTNESDANSHGFYLMRGFIDGGQEQDGFFIANTLTMVYAYSMGPHGTNNLWCGLFSGENPTLNYGWGLLRANTSIAEGSMERAVYVGDIFKLPEDINAKGHFISRLEGTPYQCCSIFAWAVISVLSLIQGQYATDTAQCAWYDNNLQTNYPKGINAGTTDADDATVTSDTVNMSVGGPIVTAGYEKTTHNGSITGITNVNGWLWQYAFGSWGEGSKLLKRSASIYDITYDNVDSSGASFWEAHSTSNISNQWGGNKSSFPDLAGADKDLFGVFAFGGNSDLISNEFGKDRHARGGSYSTARVGGDYSTMSEAGVFCRSNYLWTVSNEYTAGHRAMAYPGTAPDVKAKITVTANGGGYA